MIRPILPLLCGILFAFLPSLPVLAYEGGQRPVPITKIKPYNSPCVELSGVHQYRCRRFEAVSHVRTIAEKQEAVRFQRLEQQMGSSVTSYRLGLKSGNVALAKLEYLQKVKEQNPTLHAEYVKGRNELLQSRRELRKLTRKPTETELRKTLIKQKGDFINANRDDAVLRKSLLEENVKFIRSFRPIK